MPPISSKIRKILSQSRRGTIDVRTLSAAEALEAEQNADLVRTMRDVDVRQLIGGSSKVVTKIQKIESHGKHEIDLGDAMSGLQESALQSLSNIVAWLGLEEDAPLLLLPVRLECRFNALRQGTAELLIRIYPDDIHIDNHDPALTHAERENAISYWNRLWASGKDDAADREAWDWLVSQHGSWRAAYIRQTLQPDNLEDRPEQPPATDETPAASPGFSTPDIKEHEWQLPALAAAMPHRWVAAAFSNGQRFAQVHGKIIPDRLPVGPDPSLEPDESGLTDDGMAWMTNFDRAEAVGMGLRIPLKAEQYLAGIDRLLVYGAATDLSAEESADQIAGLLDSHHFTDGLRLPPRGEPTNNPSRPVSGALPARAEEIYSAECGPGLSSAGDGSDGDSLAAALGVTAPVFSRIQGAGAQSCRIAEHMNRVLWPATLGAFARERLTGAFTDSAQEAARQHMIDHVRGGGPLPSIVIGRQPYGILPVTAFGICETQEAENYQSPLPDLIKKLVPIWRDAGQRAKVGATGNDLVTALGDGARSRAWSRRWNFEAKYIWDFDEVRGDLTFDDLRQYARETANLLSALGLPENPALETTTYAYALPTTLPLFPADPAELSEWLKTPGNVLAKKGDPPSSLFEVMIRQAHFSTYFDAANRLNNLTPPADQPEKPRSAARKRSQGSPNETLKAPVNIEGRLMRIEEVLDADLYQFTAQIQLISDDLAQFRASLKALSSASEQSLERAMGETLDLASHRLDAWITSFATKRLKAMREQRPAGIHLGGYGWLENLRADGFGEKIPGNASEAESNPENAGYIHAPSLSQATTAAILQSGRIARDDDNFDIDLSSRRVRLARWLMDGVRQGQTVNALLGYRFEHGLQSAEDKSALAHIEALRTAFPLPSAAGNELHGAGVVDGAALVEQREKIKWGKGGLPGKGDLATHYIKQGIDEIADILDAAADLGLSESLHQIQQGNYGRASAVLNALSIGGSPPADYDVISTPRAGVPLTQKLLLTLQESRPPDGWTLMPHHIRAIAEPRLNHWVGRIFGLPDRYHCRVFWRDAGGKKIVGSGKTIRLTDLLLCPLDVLTLARPEGRRELENRILALYPQPAHDATLEIDLDPPASNANSRPSFAKLLDMAHALDRSISHSRSLSPADLDEAGNPANSNVDTTELMARASIVRQRLETAMAVIKDKESGSQQRLQALMLLAGTGLDVALDGLAGNFDRKKIIAASKQRMWDELPEESSAQDTMDALKGAFGRSFQVLPLFKVAPASKSAIEASLAKDLSISGSKASHLGEVGAISEWLEKVRKVHRKVDEFATALDFSEALTDTSLLSAWQLAQLPVEATDTWIGINGKVDSSCTGMVLHVSAPLDLNQAISGLSICEWTDVLPGAHQMTGLSFHYDAPSSVAPQCALIAVPPDDTTEWSPDLLECILNDAIDLAGIRAAPLSDLSGVGHLLPAIHLPVSISKEGGTIDPEYLDGDGET